MNKPFHLFTLWGTPVLAKPIVLANLAGVWVLITWVERTWQPGLALETSLLVGFAGMLLACAADLGHPLAHILSARRSGFPMDQVLYTAWMPRTIYHRHDIPPKAHRMRSTGGPIFNLAGLVISLGWLSLARSGSVGYDLAAYSAIAHGALYFGALLPLPYVDGGVILKWLLVEREISPARADQWLRWTNLTLGMIAAAASVLLLVLHQWTVLIVVALLAGLMLHSALRKKP